MDIAILKLKNYDQNDRNIEPFVLNIGDVRNYEKIVAFVTFLDNNISKLDYIKGEIFQGEELRLTPDDAKGRKCEIGDSGAPVIYKNEVIGIIKEFIYDNEEIDQRQIIIFIPIKRIFSDLKEQYTHIEWDAITKYSFDTGIPLKYDKLLTPLPGVSEYFIGRDNELKNLERRLFEQHKSLTMLVSGEGGIGKTTLAAAYCQKYKDSYNHIAWLVYQGSILNTLFTLEKKIKPTNRRTIL